MFSTKSEYGVRVMVQLARRRGPGPVPLAEIAQAENLPLPYLEQLVSRLRKAELVTSTRGAHGGYELARDPADITMADVVHSLEETIVPMQCVSDVGSGRMLCNHELDGYDNCATKLLWTRVQGGVERVLEQTTLAELASFAEGGVIPARSRSSAARPRSRVRTTPHEHRRSEPSPMADLEIQNLHVNVEGKEILRGVDLKVDRGEVHALMGPNGSGKSTLANTIMGHPSYEITEGKILFQGEDVTEAEPDERARAGLFMAFQYPSAIPGVSVVNFLRTAINAQRKARGEDPINLKEFRKTLEQHMEVLGVDREFTRRYLNEGFSGGEKKRCEILQLAILKPHVAVLDETDSGLDIDALRTVANAVNAMRGPDLGALIITHYQRILSYIQPDFIHIMLNGRIVEEGGSELATALEEKGYDWVREKHPGEPAEAAA